MKPSALQRFFIHLTPLPTLLALLTLGLAHADYEPLEEDELVSLRGGTPLLDERAPPRLKDFPKETPKSLPNYVGQPPLIPHSIRGYDITANNNPCLACHSLENAPKFKATPIGVSHFKDRDGNVLSDVSPSRYNCTQCHVSQKNALPLIDNLFKPVESLQP